LKYPALDVDGVDNELLLALVDDFSPTAADQHDHTVTIFFADRAGRDRARDVVVRARPDAVVSARDVDDEDWARRSQENLAPITVGRITVTPPWAAERIAPAAPTSNLQPSNSGPLTVVITPSMGFGTGHHATTRLCLAALQTLTLTGRRALDIGTGSGVLAIAARLLGAHEAVGIDDDEDAVQSARENLSRNALVDHVRFEIGDLREWPLVPADVVTANLTGAFLVRTAAILLAALAPGGTLIVSGLQTAERDTVINAFGRAGLTWQAEEDDWAALAFTPGARMDV
jgi:ribosomal protein L11 methyltransferase